jgi:amino acid adenylation domain-containing protein
MELQRDMSRSPVFDVMMVLQNQQGKAAVNEGHLVNPVNGINEVRACATKFDLLIEFIEREDGLHLYVQFNTDIYNKATIERLIMHYQQLLEQVIIHPALPLYALDYIQEADKQLLTTSFNQTETAYPRGTTWLDLFKETVMLYPERTALSNGNISFSYKELDELSDMVAAYLHRHYTIHNNDVIGIKLARSEWTVPAILGVLKAGAAYVPIDPSYPEDRIAYITEDSGAKAVIDEDMLSDILDAIVSNARKVSFFKPVSSSDLAYVIYTSGSTGKPKGVMIEHGSLYNYLSYCAEKYFNTPGKRYKVPLFTSLSFDLTVTSIFGAFLCGGELVVYPQEMNAADMLEDIFYGTTGVNFVKCTPSHIDLLQHTGRQSQVNQVITGGEALKQQHISTLQSLHTAMVIYNEYGPTEATVGCIVETLETGGSNDTVLIGKPISNMQAYILDAHQRIVPVGVTGELYLGGIQLARGYVNKEELTKSRFVEHPFENNARLYRTGDLARWLPDGNIEYLGRADDQVKINGYRIELGEVEQALLSVNGVAAAVVLAKPTGNGNTCLVGYFTGHQPVDAATLREQLLKVLPEYMVPVNFMQLDTLPLTVNGKVDKNALPVPDGLATRAAYVAPRNEVEEELVNIWQRVFNTQEKIGIRDNFIELGGNSISAIKILSKISKEYGIVISVRKMFENPTIENLANEILNAGWFSSVADTACSGEKERIRI